MMRSKLILLSLAVLMLSGCISHLRPYKMDIRQGNFVTQDMRDKLRLGMTRQQVRYVLGTPLLNDAFHGDRWDYVYSMAKHGEVVEKQLMTLYFESDNLTRIADAAMPAVVPAPVVEQPASAVVAASAVAEVPVVAVAPAVVPSVPVAAQPAAAAEATVKVSVQAWADAWSARDSKRYLAAYAPSFHPAGMSKTAWQKQRTQRLATSGAIAVVLSEVMVKVQDDSHATATFKQDYRSDKHQDNTRKTLQLEKSGDAWLIVAETTEK